MDSDACEAAAAQSRRSPAGIPESPEAAALSSAILGVLTDADRKRQYQGDPNPVAGHCYVWAEAFIHLARQRGLGGWRQMHVKHEGGPHWFVQHVDGTVLDGTAGQFATPVPYSEGRHRPFLYVSNNIGGPSKRSLDVMSRLRP